MSGGKYSVVTTIPRLLNPFSSNKKQLNTSSLVDSPEASEEPEGLVSVPGAETDFQIQDIPIVTGLESDEDMPYMKSISPECVPSFLTSTCSSPDTASLETACPPDSRDFDHMYASLSKVDPNLLMEENVHLREMLVSQLDLIQQQAETILSKDKQLKQLKEENGLLVQRLSRMERRVRGEQGQGVSQGGQNKRTREPVNQPAPAQPPVKKKKVEEKISWSLDRFKASEDVGPREDELMDEIMAESEHSGVMSRPDTPASVASNDTGRSDQTKKGRGKQKKKSLEQKRKSLPATTAKLEHTTERESRNKKLKAGSADCQRFLETESLYYVGCRNELLPNPEDKLDDVGVLQRGVEVPRFREDKHYYDLIVPNKVKMNFKKEKESTSWRVKSTNPLYSQDASGPAENISDQNLLKRHEKFEKEEKQRKRWDLQRLREEQQLQRLRARQEKQILAVNQLRKEELPSILPTLESICQCLHLAARYQFYLKPPSLYHGTPNDQLE